MEKELYFAIHGHFYQPPRENPWIEQIEIQKSAAPFHDWNERIYHECYLPNTLARVLDEKGFIVDMVNNFEGINFNVGPTLMSWLEEKYPSTYRKIIEADQKSRPAHHGHGNAIAQVYNHMIMPLANKRDKITQVKWGIEDFKKRFVRDPKAIWLPETACDEETLEVIVSEGMKYVILEPSQAKAVRPLKEEKWQDASDGKIDPKHPYRCFLKNDPEKFIDVFFYDGPISRAVGFGDLAFEARMFMDRVESAKIDSPEAQLIHLATDGETFGHHKAFGDRALAYLLSVEAPKRGFKIVNHSEYLETHPPKYAVRPNFGEKGEGTSWSCAHGIKRWSDHCGCRGAGPAEWTQYWRKPLRESLDWLRDELAKVFEMHGSSYLKDVWHARNEYIRLILDRSEKNVHDFFNQHAARALNQEETTNCLKLLEMERHAMLMYTSCGWFFTEISGIETAQILQYAARAIQLAEEITNHSYESEFLNRLSAAKSNVMHLKDGRGIYEKMAKSCLVHFSHVISYYGINSIFEEYTQKELNFYCYKLQVLQQHKESYGNMSLNFGRVKISSLITREENDLVFVVLRFGVYDFRCSVKPFKDQSEFDNLEEKLFDGLHSFNAIELIREIDHFVGSAYYSLKDIPLEWRMMIISTLTRESIEKINEAYDRIYEENQLMNRIYRSINLPIPDEIRYAVEHTLRRRLVSAVEELAASRFDSKKTRRLYRLIDMTAKLNVEIKKDEISAILSNQLAEKTKELANHVREDLVTECLTIEKTAKKLAVLLEDRAAQDHLFELFKKWQEHPDLMSEESAEIVNNIFKLAHVVRINPKTLNRIWGRSQKGQALRTKNIED